MRLGNFYFNFKLCESIMYNLKLPLLFFTVKKTFFIIVLQKMLSLSVFILFVGVFAQDASPLNLRDVSVRRVKSSNNPTFDAYVRNFIGFDLPVFQCDSETDFCVDGVFAKANTIDDFRLSDGESPEDTPNLQTQLFTMAMNSVPGSDLAAGEAREFYNRNLPLLFKASSTGQFDYNLRVNMTHYSGGQGYSYETLFAYLERTYSEAGVLESSDAVSGVLNLHW